MTHDEFKQMLATERAFAERHGTAAGYAPAIISMSIQLETLRTCIRDRRAMEAEAIAENRASEAARHRKQRSRYVKQFQNGAAYCADALELLRKRDSARG